MNRNLKKKLLNYQAEPPLTAWNRIAEALDKEEFQNYPDKLYHFEEQPPAELWQKIATQLPAKKPLAPIINYLKFSARYAAVIFVLATVGILLLLNLKKNHIALHASTVLVTKKKPAALKAPGVLIHGSALKVPASTPVTNSPLVQQSHIVKREKFLKKRHHSLRNSTKDITKTLSFSSTGGEIAAHNSNLERYVVYTNTDGVVTKVSRKIFGWLDCAYKQTASPCKQNINRVQQALASSSMAYATDFTGLLDMIKLLPEKQ